VLGLAHHPSGKWAFTVEENAIGMFIFDAATGTPHAFQSNPVLANPHTFPAILSLQPAGPVVYAAGIFDSLSGVPREGLGTVDAATGATGGFPSVVSGFRPEVDAIALAGNTLLVGGAFDHLAGQPHLNLGALDAQTGDAVVWTVNADPGQVSALAVDGSAIYAGGAFTTIDGFPCEHFAVLLSPTAAVESRGMRPAIELSVSPNPGHTQVSLRFALPAAGGVTAAVYDVAGRLLTRWPRGALAAGQHELRVPAAGWKPGLYWAVVDWDGSRVAGKFVLLP